MGQKYKTLIVFKIFLQKSYCLTLTFSSFNSYIVAIEIEEEKQIMWKTSKNHFLLLLPFKLFLINRNIMELTIEEREKIMWTTEIVFILFFLIWLMLPWPLIW